jgi:hypothetical protein
MYGNHITRLSINLEMLFRLTTTLNRVTVQNIVTGIFLNNEMMISVQKQEFQHLDCSNDEQHCSRKENVKLHDTYHREKTEAIYVRRISGGSTIITSVLQTI